MEVSAGVSTSLVEVGETFIVELSAMSGRQLRFSEPTLRAPPGFTVAGPSVQPKMVVQMGNAGTMFHHGITARWQLSASTPGTYTLPGPSVRAGGKAFTADTALSVTVVAQGQKPQVINPLDPFAVGSPLDDQLHDLLDQMNKRRHGELIIDEPIDFDRLGVAGKKLAMTKPDDSYLFLRIVPDKQKVVVGEQVLLRFYQYYRVTSARFDEREPPLPDFLRVPLEDEPGQSRGVTTSIGGRAWYAEELDRVAAFPLRAGNLHTGSLHAQFRVPYLRNQSISRESNDVLIDVREPPLEGRPPGYRVGDVGRFELSAEVKPHETLAGETVSVTVRVEGRGALPNQLKVPARTGAEWLTPEKKEGIDVQGGRVGGWRTFGYAVRLPQAGEIDLGEVELPYFDPDDRVYRVARTTLGTVRVKAKTGAAAASDKPDDPEVDPFHSLGKHRSALEPYDAPNDHAPEARMFWSLVLAPPLCALLAGLMTRGLGAWRRRRTEKRDDPPRRARQALGEMRTAREAKDGAAAGERAIHHAIEAATGLKSRGILLAALAGELCARGIDQALAEETRELLEACGTLRFAVAAEATGDATLISRVRRVVKELLRNEPEGAP